MFVKNVRISDNEFEGEIYIKIFDKYISFTADEAEREYIEKCACYLNSISEELIDNLCRASIRYCNDFLEDIGEDTIEFENIRDVLKLIQPINLSISNPKNINIVAIDLCLNCEWEIEHAMEWIIRDNEILYVGEYIGADPWGDYTIKDEWNYA